MHGVRCSVNSHVTSATEGGLRLFSPWSVCLSVCEQDISKSCGWIQTKFGGQA